jgi:hypothetical protein
MSSASESESFLLRVRFTGPCLLLKNEDNAADFRVLLPDATWQSGGLKHLDGTDAVAHAGFLRFNRAFAAESAGDVRGEIVRRLNHEEVHFDALQSREAITDTTTVADFATFAPTFKVKPGAFGSAPPSEVLARMRVTGGGLTAATGFDTWRVSQAFGGGTNADLKLDRNVTWTREMPGNSITLLLSNFRGDLNERISLRALRQSDDRMAIDITLANICATNPFGWHQYAPEQPTKADVDFKWLTKLYEIPAGVTFDSQNEVPYLQVVKRSQALGEIQNCNTGKGTFRE